MRIMRIFADGREYNATDGKSKPKHVDLTRVIIGAFTRPTTSSELDFSNQCTRTAWAVLPRHAGYRVDREAPFQIDFHGETIGRYRADLVVETRVLVEVKCARVIDLAHAAQLLNHLRVSKLRVGILLNFERAAQFKRLVLSDTDSTSRRIDV